MLAVRFPAETATGTRTRDTFQSWRHGMARKLLAEALGTALLVFIAVGVATLSFGEGIEMAGGSKSAGIIATALAFGLILLVLAYSLGPISGCHINPAVTMGFVGSGRIGIGEAVGYWIAQFVGGIAGAACLFGVFQTAKSYDSGTTGLGTNGWGDGSMVEIDAGGAFLVEAILTFVFVFVVLAVTSQLGTRNAPGFGGLAIGLALTTVHLIGIPFTGTSVNPARSLGPALFAGGDALVQVWLFIVAPLVGGLIAGVVQRVLLPTMPAGAHPAPVK